MRTFILTLFSTISLISLSFGADKAPKESNATFFAAPEAIVQNHVNAITGQYIDRKIDGVLQGPDPLPISRSYTSLTCPDRHTGWRIMGYTRLTITDPTSDNTVTCNQTICRPRQMFITEPTGGCLALKLWEDVKSPPEKRRDFAKPLIKGFCSTYSGTASAHTDLSNYIISYDHEVEGYLVVTGNGSKLYYKSHDSSTFLLTKQKLPSGNYYHYTYDEWGRLLRIEGRNSTGENLLNWADFKYSEDNRSIQITLSNQRTIHYIFDEQGRLTQSTGTDGLKHSYAYANDTHLLVKDTQPEGRITVIKYSSEDNSHPKVATLTAPSGIGLVDHSFTYVEGEQGGSITTVNGPTSKTTYHGNRNLQITKVEIYNETSAPYRTEHFHWQEGKDSHLLRASTILDAEGSCAFAIHYITDSSGNITEEKVFGNLTGSNQVPVALDESGLPSSANPETYSVYYSFSNDAFNLLTREGREADENVWTDYEYVEGTSLLKEKTVSCKSYHTSGQAWVQHYAYEYDENSALKYSWEKVPSHSRNWSSGYAIGRQTWYTFAKASPWSPPQKIVQQCKELHWSDVESTIPTLRVENHYDECGNLTQQDIFNPQDESLSYSIQKTYDQFGNLTSTTNALGDLFQYEYNAFGQKICKKTPRGTVTYAYDLAGNLTQEKAIFADGETSHTSYSYDDQNFRSFATDSLGNITKYTSDPPGRCTRIEFPKVLNQQGDACTPTILMEYDVLDRMVAKTDARGHTTRQTLNLFGKPLDVTYPDNTHEYFRYDPTGVVHRHMSRTKTVSVFDYDAIGRVKEIEQTRSNGEGKPTNFRATFFKANSREHGRVEIKHPYPHPMQFEFYDCAGRLIEESLRKNNYEKDLLSCKSYSYDPLGNTRSVSVWYGTDDSQRSITRFKRDKLGRAIEETLEDTGNKVLRRTLYAYDDYGHLSEVTQFPNNKPATTHYSYSPSGRLLQVKDPEGNLTSYSYDTYTDKCGQNCLAKTVVLPSGRTEVAYLDVVGQIIRKEALSGDQIVHQEQLRYDLGGNLCFRLVSDPKGSSYITQWTYNSANKLMEIIENPEDLNERKTTFTYNNLGQLLEKKLPDGRSLRYGHDHLDNILNIKEVTEKGTSPVMHMNWESKESSHETDSYMQGDPCGIVERKYDSLGNLAEEKYTCQNERSFSITYSYDMMGRRTRMQLPDGSFVRYTYDAAFLRKVDRYSPKGKLTYGCAFQEYDLSGRCTLKSNAGHMGGELTTYKPTGQRAQIKNNCLEEGFSMDIAHDPSGNQVSVSLQDLNDSTSQQTIYRFDALDRLVEEKGNISHQYQYDALSNVSMPNHEPQYNSLNQITSLKGISFNYDLNGNRITRHLGEEETLYSWNISGQLTKVKSGLKEIRYAYDAYGRCVRKESFTQDVNEALHSKGHEYYLYDGDDLIAVLDGKGTIKEFKLTIPGSDQALAIEIGGEFYDVAYDAFGNIIQLFDPISEGVAASYRYSAYGEIQYFDEEGDLLSKPQIPNRWLYQGKRLDPDTGFIAFGQRWYDPETLQWISPDPLGYIDGPNLYAFCRNNPILYGDATGLNAYEKDLPNFYGNYEAHCPCDEHRKCKHGRNLSVEGGNGIKSTARLKILFINGMCTDIQTARAYAQYVERLAHGRSVELVYSPTHLSDKSPLQRVAMGYGLGIAEGAVDLAQAMWSRMELPTQASELLSGRIRQLHDQMQPGDKILIVAHSRGAIETRNALVNMPREIKKRMITVSVAPGTFIERGLSGITRHYVCRQDAIPYTSPAIVQAIREGNVDFLDSKISWDHSFLSKTYEAAIQNELDYYTERYDEFSEP